jgi:hypothetical protein
MASAVQQTIAPTFAIETVQKIVAETTNHITGEMLKALMLGLQEKMSFKQLAERHIIPNLTEKVNTSDQKTQNVYQKLFKSTLENLQRNCPPLVQTLAAIAADTKKETAGGDFLGSFVFKATEPMINKLQAEQPGAVEDLEIWK